MDVTSREAAAGQPIRKSAIRCNAAQPLPKFWTAAGSEAPRRFQVPNGCKSGVAAALCHRTPKSSRTATIPVDTDGF